MVSKIIPVFGLFLMLALVSCETESVAEQEELTTVASGTGTTTSPKDGRN